MRKAYQKPVLRSQGIQLGVFGDYGRDGGAVVDTFELHLD
jgi:hypothetical protein